MMGGEWFSQLGADPSADDITQKALKSLENHLGITDQPSHIISRIHMVQKCYYWLWIHVVWLSALSPQVELYSSVPGWPQLQTRWVVHVSIIVVVYAWYHWLEWYTMSVFHNLISTTVYQWYMTTFGHSLSLCRAHSKTYPRAPSSPLSHRLLLSWR